MADAHPEPAKGVVPYLVVSDANSAIDFYTRAFGAVELFRQVADDGKRLLHATLSLNDGMLYLADDFPEMGDGNPRTPESMNGTPVTLHIKVEDVDATFAQAVDAGANSLVPVADMFWGDRFGKVRDPFGHEWSIATPIKT